METAENLEFISTLGQCLVAELKPSVSHLPIYQRPHILIRQLLNRLRICCMALLIPLGEIQLLVSCFVSSQYIIALTETTIIMSGWPSMLPNELHQEPNHRILVALTGGLMTGMGVWMITTFMNQTIGSPTSLLVITTLIAAGLMPTLTWYVLVRAGF